MFDNNNNNNDHDDTAHVVDVYADEYYTNENKVDNNFFENSFVATQEDLNNIFMIVSLFCIILVICQNPPSTLVSLTCIILVYSTIKFAIGVFFSGSKSITYVNAGSKSLT